MYLNLNTKKSSYRAKFSSGVRDVMTGSSQRGEKNSSSLTATLGGVQASSSESVRGAKPTFTERRLCFFVLNDSGGFTIN